MPFLGQSGQVSEHGPGHLLHELDFDGWTPRLVFCHFLLLLKNSSIESMTWWMSRKSIGISFNASCVTSRHVAISKSRACRSDAAAISYRTRFCRRLDNSASFSTSAVSPVSVIGRPCMIQSHVEYIYMPGNRRKSRA